MGICMMDTLGFLAGLYKHDYDVYPHLEAVTISNWIELEGWEMAQPLHLF
jgi:hypothetical protein